jgi:hypothetical protein
VSTDVKFLKTCFYSEFLRWAFLPTIATLLEALDFFSALLVVNLTFVLIAQHLVCTGDFSELAGRILVTWIFIWVVLETLFAVAALDLSLVSVL